MAKKKQRDLWTSENKTKAITRPQNVPTSKGWFVTPDVVPAKKDAPRRRKYAPIRPNNRAAVAIPMAGQSYNPADSDHQQALAKAVKTLEKKQKKNESFTKMLTFGKDSTYKGSMADDKTWEEEVKETKAPKAPKVLSPEATKKRAAEKKKKLRQQKKLGKRAGAREAKRSLLHRRHPKRADAEKEVAELEEIITKHEVTQAKRELLRERRHEQRKAKMDVKHYGRYYYEALAPDVATSDKLVGTLRHMRGGAIHPALDRMKSLEERNLVPARPRHEFNKRKVLKPKGEVRVKRETFGTLPETSF